MDVEIPNVKAPDIKIMSGVNAPDAFIQLDIEKRLPTKSYRERTASGYSFMGTIK